MADPPRPPDTQPHTTPRWVKVFGIIAAAVILLLAIVLVTRGGEHGPSRHTGGLGGRALPSIDDGV
jgi:hypothetical protein